MLACVWVFFPPSIHAQHWASAVKKKPLCLSVSVQDAQMSTALPDDSGSVLIDDTSSQWSSTADSEEERRSALEKSMYVFVCVTSYLMDKAL